MNERAKKSPKAIVKDKNVEPNRVDTLSSQMPQHFWTQDLTYQNFQRIS